MRLLPLSAILLSTLATPAVAQNPFQNSMRRFNHELEVYVWGVDGALQPDAAVTVLQEDGSVVKGTPQSYGTHSLRGWLGAKSKLEVDHPELSTQVFDLALPPTPRGVIIHVAYSQHDVAHICVDDPDKPGDFFYFGGEGDAPPPNDFCADAIGPLAIPSVTAGTTVDASTDVEFPDCGPGITSPGVWYTTIGTGNTLTAGLCTGTAYDSKISVYCGTCDVPLCVDGNDDACSLQSEISWCSEAGTEYLILVHGFGGQTGDFELTLSDDGSPCDDAAQCSAPENDLCEDAIPLAIPSVTFASTTGGTLDEGLPPCGTDVTAPGIWYTVAGTGTTVTASTCGDLFDYDTKISVFCNGCTDFLCVASNDDDCDDGASGLLSTVSFCTQEGVDYQILVHGFLEQTGQFELFLSEDGMACVPDVACIPIGACCGPDGSCTDFLTEEQCNEAGGEYQGDGTLCAGGFTGFVVEDCDFTFEDISATGMAGPSGDDASLEVPIGFDIDFFGDTKSDITISTNGYLTFGADGTDLSNDACPNPDDPNDAIFVCWDDLNQNDGGAIYYQTLGAAPNRRFIAQWDGVPEFGTNGLDTVTCQAVISESDSSIELRYLEVNGLPSFAGDVTIGVEDAVGLDAFCILDDELAADLCVRFTPSFTPPVDCSSCVTLDFQTEDDGATPLVNGQDISPGEEFGDVLSIDGTGPNRGAAIFDSTVGGPNDPGADPDLLVDRGNVLILQDHAAGSQSVPGIFDVPDDAIAGGTLVFDFAGSVEAQSVVLIDLCPGPQDGLVTLVDGTGRSREYFVPNGWTGDVAVHGPPGYGTLDLTTLVDQPGFLSTATASEDAGFDAADVVRMEVFFTSSAAVDDLVFCPQ